MTPDPDLRAELLRRMERDQAARKMLPTAVAQANKAHQAHQAQQAHQAITAVDSENLPWLKQVIADIGWPGRSAVGEDGASAAWLLAQHADRDPAFQRRCLDLLAVAVTDGEATASQLAYLTDRVLLHEGQPQEFGTQATWEAGQWAPRTLRDPDNVDQRRAAMSLGPLAEYMASIAELHASPPPMVIACPECGSALEIPDANPGERSYVNCLTCGHVTEISIGPAVPGSGDRS